MNTVKDCKGGKKDDDCIIKTSRGTSNGKCTFISPGCTENNKFGYACMCYRSTNGGSSDFLSEVINVTSDPSSYEFEVCPIVSCCEEECCGPGTHYETSKCVADATSSGYDGPGPGQIECGEKACCTGGCCAEGQTTWSSLMERCVPL